MFPYDMSGLLLFTNDVGCRSYLEWLYYTLLSSVRVLSYCDKHTSSSCPFWLNTITFSNITDGKPHYITDP